MPELTDEECEQINAIMSGRKCALCDLKRGTTSYRDDIQGADVTIEEWTQCKNECFESGHSYGQYEATLRSNHLEAGFKRWVWRYNTPPETEVAIYRDIIEEYGKAKAYLEKTCQTKSTTR